VPKPQLHPPDTFLIPAAAPWNTVYAMIKIDCLRRRPKLIAA
jgi:hypothetical protein